MAASDHLAPEQLQMFMTAGELKAMPSIDMLTRTDKAKPNSTAAMWKRKDAENVADGLDINVAKQGVHAPVTVGYNGYRGQDFGDQPHLMDGHHRVAAAFKHDPQSFVPVEHEDYAAKRTEAQRAENLDPRHYTAPNWEPIARFPSMP